MRIIGRIIFLNFLLIGISYFAIAQSQICGTIEKTDEEMQKLPWYMNNSYLYNLVDSIRYAHSIESNGLKAIKNIPDAIYRIPIQFWVYRSSEGNDNGINDEYIQERIDELNSDFNDNETGILFYRTCDINYIDNDNSLGSDGGYRIAIPLARICNPSVYITYNSRSLGSDGGIGLQSECIYHI